MKPETVRILSAMVALARGLVLPDGPLARRRRRGSPEAHQATGDPYKEMLTDLLVGPRR